MYYQCRTQSFHGKINKTPDAMTASDLQRWKLESATWTRVALKSHK